MTEGMHRERHFAKELMRWHWQMQLHLPGTTTSNACWLDILYTLYTVQILYTVHLDNLRGVLLFFEEGNCNYILFPCFHLKNIIISNGNSLVSWVHRRSRCLSEPKSLEDWLVSPKIGRGNLIIALFSYIHFRSHHEAQNIIRPYPCDCHRFPQGSSAGPPALSHR
jgi:hypothetical protein